MWSKLSRAQRVYILVAGAVTSLLAIAAFAFTASPLLRRDRAVPLSAVLDLARRHQIKSATIAVDGSIYVRTLSGNELVTQNEPGLVIAPILTADNAQVSVATAPPLDPTAIVLGLFMIASVASIALMVRRGTGARGRLRETSVSGSAEQAGSNEVTFDDVAGIEEVKNELAEVVEFLSNPERFHKIGARIPRGVLLYGPPGTGKTLLARAVAGEAGVPFFNMSGSGFVEMYVGVGAARVRDLFTRARKAAPCIVFIDELDAVGGKRSQGRHVGNDERESTLNQLLIEMDGFKGDTGVVLLAATNRPDMLDDALLRPGRFDRRVTVTLPDRAGRRAVLGLHAQQVRMEPAVDLDLLAGQTSGMSPADLANVINEAALLAARDRREQVSSRDMDAALMRVVAGPELTSRVLSPDLKRLIAYHEVGHALVMKLLPHCDPVTKVQAIPRGNALGITISMPKDEQYLLTRGALLDRMAGIMGGRAAEELFFGEVTTGAQQDIRQSNDIARRMVVEFGMSRLGHIFVDGTTMIGPELGSRIDEVALELVEEAFARARAIVAERKTALAAIADHLCAAETIEGHELDEWLERYPADADRAAAHVA